MGLSAMPPPTLSVLLHMTLLPLSTTGLEATLPTPLPRLMLLLRSSPKSLPCPTPWLRPLTPISHPQLAPSSLPLSSRPITSPSPSSRTSPPVEPSTLPDRSVPTRLSTSQSFTRPGPTPSSCCLRCCPSCPCRLCCCPNCPRRNCPRWICPWCLCPWCLCCCPSCRCCCPSHRCLSSVPSYHQYLKVREDCTVCVQ